MSTNKVTIRPSLALAPRKIPFAEALFSYLVRIFLAVLHKAEALAPL